MRHITAAHGHNDDAIIEILRACAFLVGELPLRSHTVTADDDIDIDAARMLNDAVMRTGAFD